MAREIPEVVRAFAGLAATVLDEARKLPQELLGLPVRLIGQALQVSLKLQQQYSGLVARGDEVFTGLRGDAEPGLATFDDDDLVAPPPPAGMPAPRSSAFDRVGDDADTVAEELADELADDLAVADLPLADDDLSAEVAAVLTVTDGQDDLSSAEVAALPDDPIADAVAAVVDELATEVADETAEEVPDVVPDEVLEDLTADAVAEVAEEDAAVDEAVAEQLIADAAVGGTPPTPEVHSVQDLAPDPAPEQSELIEDPAPDVAALADAEEELVDLGGPEAAESVTPESDTTDSAASDPLVPPAKSAQPATDDGPAAADGASSVTSPVEGYDAFSIPALRGRLRGYPAQTVADLLDYERATQARTPYVTLLQNRLEKLSSDRG
jgi:hypothetical protein